MKKFSNNLVDFLGGHMQIIITHGIKWFNYLLRLVKYPVALLVLVSTFFWLKQLYSVGNHIISHYSDYRYLFIGVGIYIVLWKIFFRNIGNGWFATFEHEMTHALFALLTFHQVSSLTATNRGGYIQFSGVGGGNWLITISPYFFPTFSLSIIGLMYITMFDIFPFFLGLLGFSIMYHIHSTWHELHPGQTDLKIEGFIFAWIFLPGANIMALVIILVLIPNDTLSMLNIMNQYYLFIIQSIVFIWN